MVLLLRTGLRIGEVPELDASDVRLTQRTGELVVRHGKGIAVASCRSRDPPGQRCARGGSTASATRRTRRAMRDRCGCRVLAGGCQCARSASSSRV